MTTPSEELCLACGMCCDGTFHYWARLERREAAAAQVLGLHVFTRKIPRRAGDAALGSGPREELAFRQPCAALDGLACTIYAQRPKACREYVCPLLERLEQGEIELEAALGHAREARRLMAALAEELPHPIAELPLAVQVRLNWPGETELPAAAAPILQALTNLLRKEWRMKWVRKKKPGAKPG